MFTEIMTRNFVFLPFFCEVKRMKKKNLQINLSTCNFNFLHGCSMSEQGIYSSSFSTHYV